MMPVEFYLLGPPSLRIAGHSTRLRSAKTLALLAYLVLEPNTAHSREKLAGLLWGESPEEQARMSLRQSLHSIHEALGDWGDDCLLLKKSSVAFRLPPDVWVDAIEFMSLATREGKPLDALRRAAELYRGLFLEGIEVYDSPAFEDWLFLRRDALTQQALRVLHTLAERLSRGGNYPDAMSFAQRLVSMDASHEGGHRCLMHCHAALGDLDAVRRQYRRCTDVLSRQLGAEPTAETQKLYRQLMVGKKPEGAAEPKTAVRLPSAAQTSTSPPSLSRDERRLVTILFVNLVDAAQSTSKPASKERLEKRDWCLKVIREVVSRYEGSLQESTEGGTFAFFGMPVTHENDPERAIRAALLIREAVAKVGMNLSVGINTGMTSFGLIGTPEHKEIGAYGPSVNLARRLCEVFQPGQILVGEGTYRLTHRAFEFRTQPELTLKGVAEPIRSYQALNVLPKPEKVRGIEGLTAPMIGRDEPFTTLTGCLEKVMAGNGQMVSIIGVAGVGKSRLVRELKGDLESQALASRVSGEEWKNGRLEGGKEDLPQPSNLPAFHPLWLEGRCLSIGESVGYGPFIDSLKSFFRFDTNEAGPMMVEKITAAITDLLPHQADEILPLFGNLLSVKFGNEWDDRLKFVEREQIQRQTFMALRDFFFASATKQPLVLVLEDLHWADRLSLDLISLLMEGLSSVPLMLVCVYRPEPEHRSGRIPSLAQHKCSDAYTEIHLRELRPIESRLMVEALLPAANLPETVKTLILTHSEGNPFFVEELIRSLIDTGLVYREGKVWKVKEAIEAFTVPDTIQHVILSRLDQLPKEVQSVLRCACVIGRVFPQRLLSCISGPIESDGRGKAALDGALWCLEENQYIYEERTIPELEYSFKHVLIQETVYESLTEPTRQELHRKVGAGIETLYQGRLEEFYEALAYHYDKSRDVEKAVEYLMKAGEKAKRNFADEAAVAYLTRGLSLLKTTPDTPERAQGELTLLIALGPPLMNTRGWAAPEAESVYTSARKLCQQVGDASQLFPVLWGLWLFYQTRGEHQTIRELGEQLLTLAQRAQDPSLLLQAHHALWTNALVFGEWPLAREHGEQGMALYDPQQHRSHAFLYGGHDPGVCCRIVSAQALWHLGYSDQALKRIHEALTLAQELSHPFSLAHALNSAAQLHQFRGEGQVAQEPAKATITLSTEQGFPVLLAWGTILGGWALAEGGQVEDGIAQMCQGLAAYRAAGSESWRPYFLALLADAYGKAVKAEEGLTALAEALAQVEKTGERHYEADLYRLKGELLLMRQRSPLPACGEGLGVGDPAEQQAEACFYKALDIARRQQAKSLELRAAMSLSRLRQKQGKKAEAKTLLGEIYGWFTEGFDTKDLQEAKALLEELT